MTIFGIGTDIVSLKRIERIKKKFKYQFYKKILSKNEYQEIIKNNHPINFLANRFAIKEATSKALGTGIQQGIFFKHIELYYDKLGKPKINLLKNNINILNQSKIKSIHVSLTHDELYTFAVVVIET
ncbi:Holo-[acyl-carrier-protein] synthase [Buchnera aphidicola (Eriosoma grossulariae)]|uniref:holo-ACP synthase n=1 Tax=Buchnera aphidicola TaxID=9 RepID=UPI003463AA75